jgi:recombination protein RecT
MDQEGIRRRFDELLGQRTPQFIGSLVSLLNASEQLQEAWRQAPITVIQAALKAATFDLPIDSGMGYAYIVPFRNKKPDGSKVMEASFIMGYRGMQQLAMRTGAYQKINVIDVRAGEVVGFDRLTEDIRIDFIADDDARERAPIAGYVGYFRLTNGMEKTIYMTLEQIDAHEKKHRKGERRSKGWNDDYEAMCAKTVMRRLLGKWGLMSIDYQQTDGRAAATAVAVATGVFDDEDEPLLPVGSDAAPAPTLPEPVPEQEAPAPEAAPEEPDWMRG